MFTSDGILGRKFALTVAAVDGLAMRQQVHAQNLANVDTPGYRAKTVDFESVIRDAQSSPDPGTMFNNPYGSGHGAMTDAADAADLSSEFHVTNVAGSGKVNRNAEVSAMSNDNIRYRVLTQSLTNALSGVRNVLSEMGRG